MGKKIGHSKELDSFWTRLTEAFGMNEVQEIADRLGLHYSSVYKWHNGKYPAIDTLIRISELTGISVHWLLTGKGERQASNEIIEENPATRLWRKAQRLPERKARHVETQLGHIETWINESFSSIDSAYKS